MKKRFLPDLEEWFAAYCGSFAGDDDEAQKNYALKQLHTLKVKENIRLLAVSAGLENDRLVLAEAVGLLHDVGRFEQYQRFRTFRDRDSVNHAALAVDVIRRHNLLDALSNDEAEVVIQAVRLHNVFNMPLSLSGDQRLYLNLIRDADKLDIWRVFVDYFHLPESERASAATLGFPDLAECSSEVVSCLERREMVDLALIRSVNDFKLLQLSWVFDLHFPLSFRLARQRGHLAQLAALLPLTTDVERALRMLWEYLSSRLGGLCVFSDFCCNECN
jgi:hypothetical protein